LEALEVTAVLNALQFCAGLAHDARLAAALPQGVAEAVRGLPPPAAVAAVIAALEFASEAIECLQREADGAADLPLPAFLDEVRLASQQSVGSPEGVHLTTVHQAKGLEWDFVYIVGATKGAWPGRAAGDRLEEERRLFYVAMSRAKRDLQLSFLIDPGPSPFILELPETAIRERIQKPVDPPRPPLASHPAVFSSVRDLPRRK
jgi:hypothetical protein